MTNTPIRVITVEREYGSHGGEFAHDLAKRLGWRLLDSELPCAAARAAGVPQELAARYDERLDPWYYRYGKVFWHDSGYSMAGLSDDQVFDSDRMLELRTGGARGGLCAGWAAGMLSRVCVCHGDGETRVVHAGLSQQGATCRPASGGV
jgi:hypothetical protein